MAKITGTPSENRPIGLVLKVTTNQGRSFTYFNYDLPQDGLYEITVPYSADGRYEPRSAGPCLVGPMEQSAGGSTKEVEVSEEDVLLGRTILFVLPRRILRLVPCPAIRVTILLTICLNSALYLRVIPCSMRAVAA